MYKVINTAREIFDNQDDDNVSQLPEQTLLLVDPQDILSVTAEALGRCINPFPNEAFRFFLLPIFSDIEPWLLFYNILANSAK